MISIIEEKNIGDDLIQQLNLVKEDVLYHCYLDNIKIGCAVIRNNKYDRIYLLLGEEYQGKGYGSEIFKKLLDIVKEPIVCVTPFDCFRMQRIIIKNNGREIGRNGKEIVYSIE